VKVRSYRSALREDQAEATAQRIVEAAVRVLQRNPAVLSIPAVAREAGVSVPTVYRHYGGKDQLIRAVSSHLDAGLRSHPWPRPATPADLAAHIRRASPHLDGRRALMAPALRSPEGEAFRREQLADRVALVRGALAGLSPRLPPEEFSRLVSIVTVLCTSETLGLLQEYLGLSAEEGGEAVAWAITNLCEEKKP
jgi:AcrR family transcriptional regulator